jgi:IS30 family transposase
VADGERHHAAVLRMIPSATAPLTARRPGMESFSHGRTSQQFRFLRRQFLQDGVNGGEKSPDQPVHSITFDNGTEFAECHKVAKRHQARLFLARPGCPQQRGTNENTNGLIRQYFPKGTEFNTVSPARVRQVEDLINDRPRRCLGYKTPNEVSRENYADPDCISDS